MRKYFDINKANTWERKEFSLHKNSVGDFNLALGLVGGGKKTCHYDDVSVKEIEIGENKKYLLDYSGVLINNKEISFNESYSRVNLPYGEGINPSQENLSISFWANFKDYNILDKHIVLNIGSSVNDNRFYLGILNQNLDYGINAEYWKVGHHNQDTKITPDRWYHIVTTFNSSANKAKIYINN